MGASSSRLEEDKALQLCRERKKFVKQALHGRCALAATHVAYIESLGITGTALRRFFEPEGPTESSLYTSTRATPEVVGFTDKSHSQFSLSPSPLSQHVIASENLSRSPSPSPTPVSSRYVENHMKTSGSFSKKVVEKPSVAILGSVTSSSTPKTTPHSAGRPEESPFDTPPIAPDAPPWDYFGLFHPIDGHFSSEEVKDLNQGMEGADEVRHKKKNARISEFKGEDMKVSSPKREEMPESEDEFDDPSIDKLVRSFDNVNRTLHHIVETDLPSTPVAESVASETGHRNGENFSSPTLSPLRAASGVVFPIDMKSTPLKERSTGEKVVSKDLSSCMKDIEHLFHRASESGKEVPRMLEANKLHFRPIFPGKESGGSMVSTLVKNCFSCGDDPSQVLEEPAAQTTTKYLTWHRTTSSHSSSSRNPLGAQATDDMGDFTSSIFENFCMVSGSHASTLDRLHAWERKLYDEVKASGIVRKDFDQQRKLLRLLESKGKSNDNIDKTRAVVKDLHSRIRVAIQRIDSISKKIEDLRDKELQPQLEELKKMWEMMCECHKLQSNLISEANNSFNDNIASQSDSRRQIIIHLENELGTLSSSFMKWTEAQKTYVQAINSWLYKCVSLPEVSSKRKRRVPPPPLRNFGPPIYVTCGVWLDALDTLPTKEVTDSIKALIAEISYLMPRQEKNQGKGTNFTQSTPWQRGNHSESGFNVLRDEVSENWITGFGRFRSKLAEFFGQLRGFAESSHTMFIKLQEAIEDSKKSYAQKKP